MNFNVISAIFSRNFVSYFSNPTGYLFIGLFVWLTAGAAFFPPEFFSNNLANLDQLNSWISNILLLFIPTVAMGIWADERRQGTDELLLTIPATDRDVVVGKYLALVGIYTVSLLFSLISVLVVLMFLGMPDLGLFFCNYLGYWLMGLPMLAIGMVASLLTGSLPVAFVLGLVLNIPLYGLYHAGNYMTNPEWSTFFKEWSLDGQFRDFARGVVSLPAMIYYVSITLLVLYICIMLIGRRHWLGGRDGQSMLGHYLIRTAALVGVVIGVNWLISPVPAYKDVTSAQLSALHQDTREILAELNKDRPVRIDAYVSPTVPDEYVEQRANLVSFLREFDRRGGDTLEVRLHEIEPTTDAALRAEQQYDIKPRRVMGKDRGVFRDQEIFLGVAVTSGLEKVVIPFFDRTLPVQYELARSVYTVNQAKRKRVGILRTDAELFGGFDFAGGMPRSRPEQQIITELKKQHEVIQVDPTNPITERYDVLVAVQPSTLTPPQMTNFVDAVRNGQKTAIFEDPRPSWFNVPATSEPKRSRQQQMGMMFGGGGAPEPKGDIGQLWNLLGIELQSTSSLLGSGDPSIVWQRYNPHPKIATLSTLPPQFVFIDTETPGVEYPFNDTEVITSDLQEILFPFPGAFAKARGATTTEFEPLITTGDRSGIIRFSDLESAMRGAMGEIDELELSRREDYTGESYVLAARVQRKKEKPTRTAMRMEDEGSPLKASTTKNEADEGSTKSSADDAKREGAATTGETGASSAKTPAEMDVVVVADIDLLHDQFFQIRAQQDMELALLFDNVTFVLNTIDVLAGEEQFVEIRKLRPEHRPLERVEQRMEQVRIDSETLVDEMKMKFDKEKGDAEAAMQKSLEKLNQKINDLKGGSGDFRALRDAQTELQALSSVEQRRLNAKIQQLNQEYERKSQEQDRRLLVDMRNMQDFYKTMAVFIPPIPLLLVALGVYFNRRAKEREGVSRARLR
jgi:ABC-2 type transport system permease protein